MAKKKRKHSAVRGQVTHSKGQKKLELKKYDAAVGVEARGFALGIQTRDERKMRMHKDNIDGLKAQGFKEIERMDRQIDVDPRTSSTESYTEDEVKGAMRAGIEEYRLRYRDLSDPYLEQASSGTHAPERVQRDATEMLKKVQKSMKLNKLTADQLSEKEGLDQIIPLSDEPILLAEINKFTPEDSGRSRALSEDVRAYYDFMIIKLDQTKETRPINAWSLASSYLIYRASLYGRK
ncbi:hypothetical protein LCGC14_0175870 [marine sediment metagenome]|uniref:Uncharacterized protein n=1 Tax=marine sediment metagenome TaxID=412755 RepID=A0A0F9XTT9_9ZZZZ